MDKMKQNYYGSLCTELYELLHKEAPRDELDLKQKEMLTPEGRLVFAVETMADRCPDDDGYKITASAETKEGLTLVLKSRNHYDEQSQTQFSPGIYELYDGARLLQRERMDFQTHLYRPGEMEQFLVEAGFKEINIYSSFQKAPAVDDPEKSFLFMCRVDRKSVV